MVARLVPPVVTRSLLLLSLSVMGASGIAVAYASQLPGSSGPAATPAGAGGAFETYPRELNGQPSEVIAHSALAPCEAREPAAARRPLRVATWNIRASRTAPLDAIGAELAAFDADVIALQEVDVRVRRTGFVDQPTALAVALGYHYAFTASIKWDGGDYGLAMLSRWPLAEVRRHRIEHPETRELRIVLDTTVCADGRPLRILNHHADVRDAPRQSSLADLAALARPHVGRGVVVLGDFNDIPEAAGIHALLGSGLHDLGAAGNERTASEGRIDYVLVDAPLAGATSARVWTTAKSDHNAVIADLTW